MKKLILCAIFLSFASQYGWGSMGFGLRDIKEEDEVFCKEVEVIFLKLKQCDAELKRAADKGCLQERCDVYKQRTLLLDTLYHSKRLLFEQQRETEYVMAQAFKKQMEACKNIELAKNGGFEQIHEYEAAYKAALESERVAEAKNFQVRNNIFYLRKRIEAYERECIASVDFSLIPLPGGHSRALRQAQDERAGNLPS